jgi:hypothetical protein
LGQKSGRRRRFLGPILGFFGQLQGIFHAPSAIFLAFWPTTVHFMRLGEVDSAHGKFLAPKETNKNERLAAQPLPLTSTASQDMFPRSRGQGLDDKAELWLAAHTSLPAPKGQEKKTGPIFCLWQNLIEPTEARRLHLRTASGSDWRSTDIQGRILYVVRRRTAYAKARGFPL